MKRIHTEDLIFKENRQTIPHQSKKSVKQCRREETLPKVGESPRTKAKDPAHKARNDAPRSPDRGNFLLADRNGKGGFSFAYFTNL